MARKPTAGSPGFTLMEILVAIFIFSVLFTILFGSFRFLATSSDALGTGSLQFEMGQQCMSRISADLETAFVSQPPVFKQPEFREDADPYRVEGTIENEDGHSFARIRFTSSSHFPFDGGPSKGVAEIIYYVNTNRDEGYVLRRWDRLYPYGEFEVNNADPILCKDVQGFSATYYDESGEAYDEWDSESTEYDCASPRAVEIRLELGDPDAPMIFTTRIYIPAYREKLESS